MEGLKLIHLENTAVFEVREKHFVKRHPALGRDGTCACYNHTVL